VQQRRHACFLHQHVGNPFEHFGIERVAQGLRFRHGRTHDLGALLELDPDTLAVNRLLMPIPGKALDAYLGNVAAETAIPVDERRTGPRTGCRERGGKPTGTAAYHQDIGFQNHIDRAGRFNDGVHCGQAFGLWRRCAFIGLGDYRVEGRESQRKKAWADNSAPAPIPAPLRPL